MKGILILMAVAMLAASINNYVLHDKIDSIKQEITDLRQELSYD